MTHLPACRAYPNSKPDGCPRAMPKRIDKHLKQRLICVGRLLVDQERAQVLVEPRARESGF